MTDTYPAEATAESRVPSIIAMLTSVSLRAYAILIVWTLLALIFRAIGFGLPWVIVSGIGAIFLNLGTRRPGDSSLSAYSIFNPNMQAIPGTLTAEQFLPPGALPGRNP